MKQTCQVNMSNLAVLDHEKEIVACERKIDDLQKEKTFSKKDLERLIKKLGELKKKTYEKLTPWQRVQISRHPNRPRAVDYIKNLFEDFQELSGDRAFRDDPAIITGIGTIQGQTFALVAQEKGNDTQSRIQRNFGMAHPEGFRKGLRLMKLAEKFDLPVICLLDTPGAYAALPAEERGQGRVIAENLFEMSTLKTQLIVLLIGEGASGGALALGMGDIVAIMENSYYSVISPEACASILYKDAAQKEKAAEKLKLLPEDLYKLRVIDRIVEEPLGGAHLDHKITYQNVTQFILESFEKLKSIDLNLLIERRYAKFRSFGEFEE